MPKTMGKFHVGLKQRERKKLELIGVSSEEWAPVSKMGGMI